MIEFTRKGYIRVMRGEEVLSEHVEERKAIQACDGFGEGEYVLRYPDVAVRIIRAISDVTPPGVPSGFSASAATASSVSLTWTANGESDFSNYVVWKSVDGVNFGYLGSSLTNSYTDVDSAVGSGVLYYQISALDVRGNTSARTSAKSAGPYVEAVGWSLNLPSTIQFTDGAGDQYFSFGPYLTSSNLVVTALDPASTESNQISATLPAQLSITSESPPRLKFTDSAGGTYGPVNFKWKAASSALSDWQSRISGAGVVWYHDFDSADEVNAFRWSGGYGNDPNDVSKPSTVNYVAAGGIGGGGCLEIYRPAGTTDGAVWWRPFSPIQAKAGSVLGNGRTTADPGASGTITARAWNPTNGSSTTANHAQGTYGNAAYTNSNFDGASFYLQMRVKTSANRFLASQPTGGKRIYLSRTDYSFTAQEIVWESKQNPSPYNYFSLYRSGGTPLEGDASNGSQPGNENNSPGPVCSFTGDTTNCWQMEPDTWETYLFRIVPGLEGNNDGVVTVWAAHEGETSYTKIWDMSTMLSTYEPGAEKGFNALICSGYMNGQNMTAAFYHRFDQIIFSTQIIACPQV